MRINNLNDLPEHLRKQVEKQIGPVKKKSKHNNVKTLVGDELLDSGREAVRYGELLLLQQVDEITALQRQVWFLLEPKNSKNNALYYIADFVYFDCRLKEWVVEDSKGFRTDTYKIKKKLMYNKYGIDIKEV
ncbi:MAG TPA: DUF1064 domain-containing protein [Methanosarcinales archaeon]|nr:DUF1064 domain-containing protein [Methanosarcinales archaeon]